MSIRCKNCGKFIWSFSTTLCGVCHQEEVNAVYRNQDFYRNRNTTRFVPRGSSNSSVAVSDVADVDYTPSVASSWFSSASDTSSYTPSDSSSYSCSDSGSSGGGGCD